MGVIKLETLADNSLVHVQDINDLKAIRVTGWQRFSECPKRWYAEMLGLSDIDATKDGTQDRPQNKWAKIGTAAHHVIETFLTPAWTDADWYGWAVGHCVKEGMPPQERQNLKAYIDRLDADGWRRRAVVTELKLEGSPQPYGLPVGGTLDYIGWNEELGCWDILDHKTNRSFEPVEVWAEKIQPLFYTWLLRNYLREQGEEDKPIRYTIGYVNLGQMMSWMTDPATDERVEQVYEHLWQEFSTYRRTGEWPERVNEYCASCPLMKSCGAAQKALNSFAALAEEQEERGVSMLERANSLSNTIKLAESLLEGVREEIRNRMLEDGVEVLNEAGLKASLTRPTRRTVDFWDLWDVLRPQIQFLDQDQERQLGDLFRVNLSALDRYVTDKLAEDEELVMKVAAVIQTAAAETPTLSIRRAARK